jgi:hypothetical protein
MFAPGHWQRIMAAGIVAVALALHLAGSVTAAPAAAADPEQEAIERAVAWLRTQQLPDGSFGYKGKGSAAMTADVVYALALAGEQPDEPAWTTTAGRSALDALAELAPAYMGTDAGQAGKVARAVSLAGGDPRAFGGLDLIAIIEAAYDPATGRYHPSFAFRHTLAVEALHRAGVEVPPAASMALRLAQLPDGGWFWSFNQADGAEKSDVDTTGRALLLLGELMDVQDACAYRLAEAYLADMQLPGGGWSDGQTEGAPANANSTALAIAGLNAAGSDPQGALYQKNDRDARAALLAFQEPSGAFVYSLDPAVGQEVRVMATAEALVALHQPLNAGHGTCKPVPYFPMILR